MAKQLPTIWALEPHTLAKHAILRRYLQAWIPILGRWNSDILYIDGFAGPGVYLGAEPGSPIIALQTAIEHQAKLPGNIHFWFIEKDPARARSLEDQVSRLDVPARFRVHVKCEESQNVLAGLIHSVRATARPLIPTFAFLDPFGFTQTPFDVVRAILQNQRCEVLITFMYEEINRFLDKSEQTCNFDVLFGSNAWRDAARLTTPRDRQNALRDLYRNQLRRTAKHVLAFEIRNKDNRLDYFLFFATNNLLGVSKMKEAMWKVDPESGLRFSDATDPSQVVIFDTGPDAGAIERRLRAHFASAEANVAEVETFLLSETPWRDTHYKMLVLKPLELRDPPGIVVVRGPAGRRRGTFPPETVIRFI